jgi:hypothetical protein
MHFKEILSRLTGFSTPVFGASWNPPEADVTVARRVITFLEDRRVFYNPYDMEMPSHCADSIVETRKFLTETIGHLKETSKLAPHLRAIRAACREFLDSTGQAGHSRGGRGRYHGPFDMFQALGQLRATSGIRIAAIAVMYGLPVEGELAEILPPVVNKGTKRIENKRRLKINRDKA